MYDNYMKDIKTIKSYESKVKKFGVQYGSDNLNQYLEYNSAKYRLSIDGLNNAT